MSDHDGTDPLAFITPLLSMCAQQREMFDAWQRAGFTEGQAMELLKATVMGFAIGAAQKS